MVAHTRAARGPGALRALNQPQPIQVRQGLEGVPTAVLLERRWVAVATIEDAWRLDDEWWRDKALSRLYFRVALDDGPVLCLFKDLESSAWYSQRA